MDCYFPEAIVGAKGCAEDGEGDRVKPGLIRAQLFLLTWIVATMSELAGLSS